MIVYTFIILFVFLFYSCTIHCNDDDFFHDKNAKNESDESNEIRQALFLVNLLKSEFRLRKQNRNESLLKHQISNSSPALINAVSGFGNGTSTKASIQLTALTSLSPLFSTLPSHGHNEPSSAVTLNQPYIEVSPKEVPAYVEPLVSNVQNTQSYPYGVLRRRMPTDYFFSESLSNDYFRSNFRRSDVGQGSTTNQISTKESDSKGKEKNILKVLPERHFETPENYPKTKVVLLNEDNVKVSQDPTDDDPIMDQVAAELLSELKEEDRVLRFHNEPKKAKIFLRNNQPHLVTLKAMYPSKADSTIVKAKGTLRIHLARSSRYPLPLPENNAFCYYVPNSPLCHPT